MGHPFDIEALMRAQQQPDPEQVLRAQRLAEAVSREETASRRRLVANAWLFCSCRRYFDWEHPDMPAQAGCPVHGALMVLDGTGEVI